MLMRKRILMTGVLATSLLAGCLVRGGHRGSGAVLLVPALPSVVVLEAEPYYEHGGYFYFYQGDRWSYSKSRSGPWTDLPRDRYPKEVKHKNRGNDQGRGEKRGHDKQDRD